MSCTWPWLSSIQPTNCWWSSCDFSRCWRRQHGTQSTWYHSSKLCEWIINHKQPASCICTPILHPSFSLWRKWMAPWIEALLSWQQYYCWEMSHTHTICCISVAGLWKWILCITVRWLSSTTIYGWYACIHWSKLTSLVSLKPAYHSSMSLQWPWRCCNTRRQWCGSSYFRSKIHSSIILHWRTMSHAPNFQDSMAIACYFGQVDIFMTMTTNPLWSEITHELLPR